MKSNKLSLAFLLLYFSCLSFAGSIESVSPEIAVPGETLTLTMNCADTTLTGETILAVALMKDDSAICAESFRVVSDTQLEADFVLPGSLAKGSWSLAVEIEGTDMHLENSFSVFNPDINGDGTVDLSDFSFYANYFLEPMPGYILVPHINLLTPEQAEAAITAAGLRVGYRRTVFSTVVYGRVAAQIPLAGTAVRASDNITVNFDVSGVPMATVVTVPLLNMYGGAPVSLAEAQARLISEGFSVGEITFEHSSLVPYGYAINYDPPSGSYISYYYSKSEISIGIIVSSQPQWGVVPGLYSLTQAEAQQIITSTGFNIGSVTTVQSSLVPLGCVVSQNPPAGEEYSQPQNVSVDIAISGVPLTTSTTVPNLAGLTPAEANSAIISAGLSVGNVVNNTPSQRVIDGSISVCNEPYVYYQNPAAGSIISGNESHYVDYSYTRDCYYVED